MRNPGTAAVLSLIIPGLGQLYNGTWIRAILWLVFAPGLWLGTGGFFGWVAHVIAAITAYHYAKDHPHREFD
jgi:TM2 domain-containing membrane protein YozV